MMFKYTICVLASAALLALAACPATSAALECVCCFEDCCFGCETARQFYDDRPHSLDGLCSNESKEEEASEDDA